MQWEQDNTNFKYNVTPVEQDIPIANEELHSTYDQFINLRDTLVFSGKQYSEHPGKKLIVGYKKSGRSTMTVEVQEREFFRQQFEPGYVQEPTNPNKIQTMSLGDYITHGGTGYPTGLVCTIHRTGWYRIIHKEEIKLQTTTNKVCCYVDILRKVLENDQWVRKIAYPGGICVFDWEGGREDNNTHYKKTFTGTTSGTDPNGSCSVTVSFTLGDIIQKMTAFGYMERELLEGDILLLRLKDQGPQDGTGEPQGNDLVLQDYSNYRSVEYIDLSYNELKNG